MLVSFLAFHNLFSFLSSAGICLTSLAGNLIVIFVRMHTMISLRRMFSQKSKNYLVVMLLNGKSSSSLFFKTLDDYNM